MKTILGLAVVALALVGCSSDPEVKTEREAVESVRDAMGIDVSEQEASQLMHQACAILDTMSPRAVMVKMDTPPIYTRTIMNNATQVYCSEHREKVVDYLEG